MNWPDARAVDPDRLDLLSEAPAPGEYDELPAIGSNVKQYAAWSRELQSHVYQNCPLTLLHCRPLQEWSREGEREGDFRGRLTHQAREQRDLEVDKIRALYTKQFETMQDRIRRVEDRRDRNAAQFRQQKLQTAFSFGATVLGAMMGRKVASANNIGRAVATANRAQRSATRKGEIARAEQELQVQQERFAELEKAFQEALRNVEQQFHAEELPIESEDIAPRKSDISIR